MAARAREAWRRQAVQGRLFVCDRDGRRQVDGARRQRDGDGQCVGGRRRDGDGQGRDGRRGRGEIKTGAPGAANATSTAETAKGALAQAQSTAVGSSGKAQSTALTSFSFVKVQSAAVAQVGSTATTNAIAQGGGSGQAFVNPGQTAYAFSTALPDKAYSATLIDGAHDVAGALLGPRDMVFGAAIVGANYASDGGGESHTYSATSTFDFGYGGDLMLGLIDDQLTGFAGGLGFQSMEFTVTANGVELLDSTFRSLAVAESFFRDRVIDLGSDFGGPGIDLTIAYNLVADGSGGFGFDFALGGAVPEPSTWAMMLIGFAGLGFAGYRRAENRAPPRLLVPVHTAPPIFLGRSHGKYTSQFVFDGLIIPRMAGSGQRHHKAWEAQDPPGRRRAAGRVSGKPRTTFTRCAVGISRKRETP